MKKKERILIVVAAIILIGVFTYFFVAFNEPRYGETVQTTVSPEHLQRPIEILVSESPTAEVTAEPQPQPAPPPPPYPSKIS